MEYHANGTGPPPPCPLLSAFSFIPLPPFLRTSFMDDPLCSDCQHLWFSIITECVHVINACIITIIIITILITTSGSVKKHTLLTFLPVTRSVTCRHHNTGIRQWTRPHSRQWLCVIRLALLTDLVASFAFTANVKTILSITWVTPPAQM